MISFYHFAGYLHIHICQPRAVQATKNDVKYMFNQVCYRAANGMKGH